jgi:hypothetical protein
MKVRNKFFQELITYMFQYPIHRRLGVGQSWFGRYEGEANFWAYWEWNSDSSDVPPATSSIYRMSHLAMGIVESLLQNILDTCSGVKSYVGPTHVATYASVAVRRCLMELVPQRLVVMATSRLVCKTYHQASSGKSRCKLATLLCTVPT